MKKVNNQDLDDLFAQAKNAQDKVAETAELGVESRLKSRLTSQENDDEALWLDALKRLCVSGGLVAIALGIWVIIPGSEGNELTSLVIEQWLFGII